MQISGIIGDAHPENAARCYSTLAEVYEELGDRDRALELSELAAELLGPGNPSRYLAGIHARMAELFEAEGNAGAAYGHMKKVVGVQQDPAARPTP